MIPDPLDYLAGNEQWDGFVTKVSDNTGAHYEKLWLDNVRANRELIRKSGWAAVDLDRAHAGKTLVMLGASPAIRNQVDQLRELSHDPDFVLLGVSSGLEFLLENGVVPKYVVIADADPAIERFWKSLNLEMTKDITLISNMATTPKMFELWKGPIKFLGIFSAIKKLDRKFHKWFPQMNGDGTPFHSLMSQFNTGTAFGFLVLGCKIIIFVGNEFGFRDKEEPYYVDREDIKDKYIRKPHMDIRGEVYYTTFTLMALKLILEDFLGKISGDGWFLNCTEAGIFGVSAKYGGHLPWIKQLTLEWGIRQARMIMATGNPIYAPH